MRNYRSVLCLLSVLLACSSAVQPDHNPSEKGPAKHLESSESALRDQASSLASSIHVTEDPISITASGTSSGHASSITTSRDERASSAYHQALQLLQQAPPREPNRAFENVVSHGKFRIPQYNSEMKSYEFTQITPPHPIPEIVISLALPLLEEAVSLDYVPAIIDLADIYIFGNYSVTPDYHKSLQLYHKAVSIEGNGHAYFMLGFIYSSGLFGEVEVDQIKAHLYYQLGMENGDLNATIALAYRTKNGIGTPINQKLALHYYARLATIAMDIHENQLEEIREQQIPYNIKISDFNGGLYGFQLTESADSIDRSVKIFDENLKSIEEYNLDRSEYEYVNLYYSAMKYYFGGYFFPRNRTRAFEYLQECVQLGNKAYGSRMFKDIDPYDKRYLARCYSKLGHMYYKGIGVQQNTAFAKQFHEISLKISPTSQSYNDMGSMIQEGIEGTPVNESKVIENYALAMHEGSFKAQYNMAKFLIELSPNQDPMQGKYSKEIYQYIESAALSGVFEALYYYGEFAQSGFQNMARSEIKYDPSTTAFGFKSFIERSENIFFPHLKYAFDEFIAGNFQNALIGYSMGAEQGLGHAQVSAAYLLYQMQPLKADHPPYLFQPSRVKSAIKYLERSSAQFDIDSMIMLGDLYLEGVEVALEPNFAKAFQYFQKAAKRKSSHASYKLGYMYEYGLGTLNNTIDFFMAKRYYDNSLSFIEEDYQEPKLSHKFPIQWALLRLRLKYLFGRGNTNSNYNNQEKNSWFHAIKEIGRADGRHMYNDEDVPGRAADRTNNRADAHHEGRDFDDLEAYEAADYIVIILTVLFFMFFFLRNIYRMWNMRNNNNAERDFRFGFNGFGFNMGNAEVNFRFFAL